MISPVDPPSEPPVKPKERVIDRRRREVKELRDRIVQMLATTDLTFREIGAKVGVSGAYVGQVNKAEGVR